MVLHLSTFHLEGGAGVAAARLHHALLKSGTESSLLVAFPSKEEQNVYGLGSSKWELRKMWGRFTAERLLFYPQEADKSVRFAFSPAGVGADISAHPLVQKAEILHLHWINFGFLSLKSLEKLFALNKPVVWTMHDMWTMTGGCHYSRGCERFLSHCQYCPYLAKSDIYDISFTQFEAKKALYSLAKTALISPSLWLDTLTKKAALTKDLSSFCIPNCIDTTLFKPVNKLAARDAFGLPADKKLILFTGANIQDKRKGFVYFQEALKQVRSSYPEIEVMLFGKADASGFADFPVPVHYIGKISDTEAMVNAYNAADLIVVPSLEDNLPNTIMEAMSCGTPAVGFDTGGIPEMIDHGINGFVAEQKSAGSLAAGISWVLENNGSSALSAAAREKVVNNYSESLIAARYQAIYNSLLNG
ncbi:glycosyltransferase family 4 protein [Dyadobacter crusticola]|uniref:glycosyltransferase family 4 protein n=1 Tax=Dyadobacter crusticola TaxID=292407 RepID=UPI0004E17C8C|nr:glycosyltransferase family 4 protein [Dyadobacter crusticola]